MPLKINIAIHVNASRLDYFVSLTLLDSRLHKVMQSFKLQLDFVFGPSGNNILCQLFRKLSLLPGETFDPTALYCFVQQSLSAVCSGRSHFRPISQLSVKTVACYHNKVMNACRLVPPTLPPQKKASFSVTLLRRKLLHCTVVWWRGLQATLCSHICIDDTGQGGLLRLWWQYFFYFFFRKSVVSWEIWDEWSTMFVNMGSKFGSTTTEFLINVFFNINHLRSLQRSVLYAQYSFLIYFLFI